MEPFGDSLSLTVILFAFDWSKHNKAFDFLMIGHRGATRSLLGARYGHVRGSNGWHQQIECDIAFIRVSYSIVRCDNGEVMRGFNL